MSPKILFNPNELNNITNGKHTIFSILKNIKQNKPKGLNLIGIASNIMLGVFQLDKVEDGYVCKRICEKDNKLIISDISYPVTNLGTPSTIDCEIDYIVKPEMLNYLKEDE